MRKHTALAVSLALIATDVAFAEVTVTTEAPVVTLKSPLADDSTFAAAISNRLTTPLDEFADGIADELSRFDNQDDLALGFANAGASGAHVGTLRSFSDYRRFALVVSPGLGFAAPGTDFSTLESSGDQLIEEGDTYIGAAIQPIVVSAGLHLAPLVNNLYINAKFGYASIAEGTVTPGLQFDSYSLGVMANYQLLESRSLPLGFIRWRGLSVGSGLLYQENNAEYTLELGEIGGDDGAEANQVVTYGDVGLTQPQLNAAYGAGAPSVSDTFALFSVTPTLTASIESSSVTIPLEVSTGLRLLWLFDVNVGAGIDVNFGSSTVGVSSRTELAIDGDDFDSTPGAVTVASKTTGDGPGFVRPRLTAGAGINLGPIKLDVPLMYYFDGGNTGLMAGVNLGIVW